VGQSTQPKLARITIVVGGDNPKVEQVRKQLDKIIEVVKIVDVTSYSSVAREIALIKVKATPATRAEIIQVVGIFRANIVDVSADSLIIEVTGDQEKVDSLLELLRGFGIREIARTGLIALTRGGMGPLQVDKEKLLNGKPAKAPRLETETAPDW